MIDVGQRFFDWAAAHPDHPAVVEDEQTTTYGELAALARRIAAVIPKPGARVLICPPRRACAYAGMFACALVGAVYAPVNIDAPLAKRRAVFRRFEPDAVISDPSSYADLCGDDGPPLIDPAVLAVDGLDTPPPSRPLGTAYVIFTSGSTGEPKGVAISRASLAAYVTWALRDMAVTPSDRWSQHPNIAFDLSVLDIYGALCGGATLYPLTGARDRLMPAMAVARHRLTIWNSVPSVMGLMIQAGQVTTANFASLRLLTFCGEPLLPEHLDAIFAARPDVIVHNTYGPTEATVSCTALRLRADNYRDACGDTVAVGDPIDDMALFLADGPGPDEGELLIAGPQLAEGYWRDPDATAKAFRRRDINGVSTLVYHTGDWFRRDGGRLFFARRMDTQVKVRGHRLELEEVNAALRRCGAVTACVILCDGRLHAFLEAARPMDVDVGRLRESLLTMLEPHAVPSQFHVLPHLPRNANDKIDARALAALTTSDRDHV